MCMCTQSVTKLNCVGNVINCFLLVEPRSGSKTIVCRGYSLQLFTSNFMFVHSTLHSGSFVQLCIQV